MVYGRLTIYYNDILSSHFALHYVAPRCTDHIGNDVTTRLYRTNTQRSN